MGSTSRVFTMMDRLSVIFQAMKKSCIIFVTQVTHLMKMKNRQMIFQCSSLETEKVGLLCCLQEKFAQIHLILYV